MSAREKRRFAVGTVVTLVTVGVVAVLVIAWPGSSSRSGSGSQSQTSKQTSKEVYGTFGTFGVVYGVHGSQLLARFGAPDQKRNGCWVYRIHGDAFHGIKLNAQTAGMDAVRYCFFSGVVAIIKNHWPPGIRNNSQSGAWLAPFTYGCGGGPCKLQDPPRPTGG